MENSEIKAGDIVDVNITDPFKEGVFALSDYDVKDITGIWKIQ